MLNIALLSLGSAVLWCLLQNSFTPQNFVVGLVLGTIIGFLVRGTFPTHASPRAVFSPRQWIHAINYTLHLMKEILVANLKVTRLVLTPVGNIRPGIVALPIDVEGDIRVTMLGNSITLTPGTITMLVSEDQDTLYIHTLDIEEPEETKREIKDSLEKYIVRLGH